MMTSADPCGIVAAMELPRQIDTPRLRLRCMRPSDAADVYAAYASDPAVLRYLGWQLHRSADDARKQIGYDAQRWLKGLAWVWGLTRRGFNLRADRVFGQIELVPMAYPGERTHHLRLGYLMARSHWGQGLMTEAAQAVLKTAFARNPTVWRIDALCDVDNHASADLLTRLGMVREGRMHRAVVHPNVSAAPRDAWLFAMTRDEWVLKASATPATEARPACAEQSR